MNLRELASPRFYATLMADFDRGRGGALACAPSTVQRVAPLDTDDDFEETRPCPWFVTATDDPPAAVR